MTKAGDTRDIDIYDYILDEWDCVMELYVVSSEDNLERDLRIMDRDTKTINNRPSNHHGSNPRRSK
jgi:hypothetical protein